MLLNLKIHFAQDSYVANAKSWGLCDLVTILKLKPLMLKSCSQFNFMILVISDSILHRNFHVETDVRSRNMVLVLIISCFTDERYKAFKGDKVIELAR